MSMIDLEARPYRSRVLDEWVASDPARLQRAASAVAVVANQQIYTVKSSDADGMRDLFAPISAASGFPVTDRTAMQVGAVYACLSKLSGAVSQLPVHLYKVDANGDRARVRNSPLRTLLNLQPHPRWTAASWKEWITRCVALRGDQYTQIHRTSDGRGGLPLALEPHHPDHVVPRVFGKGGMTRLVYDINDPATGRRYTVDQDDMLHFPGFGFNGLCSLSAIQHAAKQAVGNSLAASQFAGRTIGEGAMPQIAITYPARFDPKQSQQLRDSFVATYGGHQGRKLPLVLSEGGKVESLSISPVDMELMAMRGFEKSEICEALGVPPILIGNSDKTSSWGTGIEQIVLGFVKFTVKPMLARWEEELNRKLCREGDEFLEFELAGLLSGDSKAQSEAFRGALGGPGTGNGYRTQNEVRKLLNLSPDLDPKSDQLFRADPKAAPAKTPDTSTGENEA